MEILCVPEHPRPQPFSSKPGSNVAVQLTLFPKEAAAEGSPSNAQAVLSSVKKVKVDKPWKEPVLLNAGRLAIVAMHVAESHVLAIVAMREGSVRLELVHLLDSLVVGLQALWPEETLCSLLDSGDRIVKAEVDAYLAAHLEKHGEFLRLAQLFLRSVPAVDIYKENMALAAHFEETFDILEAHCEAVIETLSQGDLALPVGIAVFALTGVCFHTSLPTMILFPLFNALKLWNIWVKALNRGNCFSEVRHFFAELPPMVEGERKKRQLVVAIVVYAGVISCRVMAPNFTSDVSEPPATFGHVDPFGVVEAKRVLLDLRATGVLNRIRRYLGTLSEISLLRYEDDGILRLSFAKKPRISSPVSKGRPRSHSDVQIPASRHRRRSTIGQRTSLRPRARGRRRLSFAGNEDADFMVNEPVVPIKVKSILTTPPIMHKIGAHLETIGPKLCKKEIVTMTPQERNAPLSIDTTLSNIDMSIEALEDFERHGLVPNQTESKPAATEAKKMVSTRTLFPGTWAGPIVVDTDAL